MTLGISGGLAGSWLMNQSQAVMRKFEGGGSRDQQQTESATVVLAEKVSQAATGSSLPPVKKTAEKAVHWNRLTL